MNENKKPPSVGEVVLVQGYEFCVERVWLDGDLVRFVGRCTPDERNNSIRGTGYDGGVYGWRINP